MDKISVERLETLHPRYKELFQVFFARVVAEVRVDGFWRVTQAFRYPEYQADLHKNGISPCDAWQSPHNYGLAIDIGHINGMNLINFTQNELTTICKIAKELNLVCGIEFKAKDSPHFEVSGFEWKKFKVKLKDKDGWVII